MDLVISSGHGQKIQGAVGILNEVTEARKVVDRIAELLKTTNVGVKTFHDNTSTTVSTNLSTIVGYHNSQTRDRDISVHFNAYQSTDKPMGAECLYVTQQQLAAEVSLAMSIAGGFINRGAKKRTDLSFLNNTDKPAILLEVCFVDSSHDANLYRQNFETICRNIAESISGVKLPAEPQQPSLPPTDPTPPSIPTGDNIVDMVVTVKGSPTISVNGEEVLAGNSTGKVDFTMAYSGDAIVVVNGEEFQVKPPATAPISRPTIREGSRGPDVLYLQQKLKITPADSIFGPITKGIVESFQRAQGLVVDGIVGPQTWAAVEKA